MMTGAKVLSNIALTNIRKRIKNASVLSLFFHFRKVTSKSNGFTNIDSVKITIP